MIVKRWRSKGGRQQAMVVSTTCPWCGASKYTKNGQFYHGNQHERVLDPSWSSKHYERHAQLGPPAANTGKCTVRAVAAITTLWPWQEVWNSWKISGHIQPISQGFWLPSATLCQMVLSQCTSLAFGFDAWDGSMSLFSQQNPRQFRLPSSLTANFLLNASGTSSSELRKIALLYPQTLEPRNLVNGLEVLLGQCG